MRGAAITLLAACGTLVVACSQTATHIENDPTGALKNPELNIPDQVRAIEGVWSRQDGGRESARETLKTWAWRTKADFSVRKRALELLFADPLDVDHADTRAMMRLMLPTEPNSAVTEFICQTAVANQWTECAPAIVRSWARTSIDEENRPERAAMAGLFKGRPLHEGVYQVFATPVAGDGESKRQGDLARSAAWEVLTRLDPGGEKRLEALRTTTAAPTDALMNDLRAAERDMHVIPLTANQLEWLKQMRRFDAPSGQAPGNVRRAWWTQTAAVIAGLSPDKRANLHMRNLEALRIASISQPSLLQSDRAKLWAELLKRTSSRPQAHRSMVVNSGVSYGSERLVDHEEALTWADLVTIIVIDDVLKGDAIRQAIWAEAVRDAKTLNSELGGLIHTESDSVQMLPYDPRGVERRNDEKYTAPEELFTNGPLALCHYHFHAQRLDNRQYAGPGVGDGQFARDQGRACILFTPVGDKRIDVDYYHDGLTVDLGEIVIP